MREFWMFWVQVNSYKVFCQIQAGLRALDGPVRQIAARDGVRGAAREWTDDDDDNDATAARVAGRGRPGRIAVLRGAAGARFLQKKANDGI